MNLNNKKIKFGSDIEIKTSINSFHYMYINMLRST